MADGPDTKQADESAKQCYNGWGRSSSGVMPRLAINRPSHCASGSAESQWLTSKYLGLQMRFADLLNTSVKGNLRSKLG
jgi:hypothetical protein